MKLIVKIGIAFVIGMLFLYATVIFGGYHYCFPGTIDNGPGTIGCFYSN